MAVATTYEDRLALIKTIAERRKRMAKVRNQSKKLITSVKPSKARDAVFDVPKESNMYQWTDAPKYAEKYYGETFRETTKYDNDWGDY